MPQLIDGRADFLDLGVGKIDGIDDRLFLNLTRARLDHHDSVRGAHHHNVQQAVSHLTVSWIHDKAAVDQTYAYGAYRPLKGNVRDCQGTGCSIDGNHIGIVLSIGGQDKGNNLGLTTKSFGEQRPDRPVNNAASQDLALAGTAFALDEAAGNPPASVGIFAIIDSEREEVNAFPRVGVRNSGGKNDVITHAHDSRAMRLFGQVAGFERKAFATGKLNEYFVFHDSFLFYKRASFQFGLQQPRGFAIGIVLVGRNQRGFGENRQ